MSNIDPTKVQEVIDFLDSTNLSQEQRESFVARLQKEGVTPELQKELDEALKERGNKGLAGDGKSHQDLQMAYFMEERSKELEKLQAEFDPKVAELEDKIDTLLDDFEDKIDALEHEYLKQGDDYYDQHEAEIEEKKKTLEKALQPQLNDLNDQLDKEHKTFRAQVTKLDERFDLKLRGIVKNEAERLHDKDA